MKSIILATAGQQPRPASIEDSPGYNSTRRWFTVVALAIALVAAIAVVWLTRHILLLLFGGLLLATFLCGLTGMVERRTRLRRGAALSIVLVVLVAIVGCGGWFLGSQFLDQLDEMQTGLSQAVTLINRSPLVIRVGRLLNWDDWSSQPSTAQISALLGYVHSGIAAVLAPTVVLVSGIYLAIDPATYRRGLMALVPRRRRPRTYEILGQVGEALWAWLWARLLSMTIIAVTTLVGLWWLGMPMSLSLAMIAFVTNFIPYIGPASSAVPAILIALTISPTKAVHVALLYLVIQGIETNLVTPLMVQKSVDLPPVFTLGVQMILGLLCGLLGVLFATPLSAVAVVLVRTLYVEDVIGIDGQSRGNSQ